MATSKQVWPIGTMQFAIRGNFQGAPFANVLYLHIDGGTGMTEGDVQTLLDDMIGAVDESGLYQNFNSALHVTSIRGNFHQQEGVFLDAERAASIAGGDAGYTLDAGAALVLSWGGRWRYRGGKPRTYLPGLSSNKLTDTNSIADTFCDAVQSDASSMLGLINGLTNPAYTAVELGTVAFRRGKNWLDEPFFNPYTSVVVHPRVNHQRRRVGAWQP